MAATLGTEPRAGRRLGCTALKGVSTKDSLSQIIARQAERIRELEALVDALHAERAAQGLIEFAVQPQPDFLIGMSQQARAVVGALFAAYPRALHRYVLLEALPGYCSVHERGDRQPQLVTVAIHYARKVLGPGAIITHQGQGYALSQAAYERLSATPAAAPAA